MGKNGGRTLTVICISPNVICFRPQCDNAQAIFVMAPVPRPSSQQRRRTDHSRNCPGAQTTRNRTSGAHHLSPLSPPMDDELAKALDTVLSLSGGDVKKGKFVYII